GQAGLVALPASTTKPMYEPGDRHERLIDVDRSVVPAGDRPRLRAIRRTHPHDASQSALAMDALSHAGPEGPRPGAGPDDECAPPARHRPVARDAVSRSSGKAGPRSPRLAVRAGDDFPRTRAEWCGDARICPDDGSSGR